MDRLKQHLVASNQKAALGLLTIVLASLLLLLSLLSLGCLGWFYLPVAGIRAGLKLTSLALPVALVWVSSAGWGQPSAGFRLSSLLRVPRQRQSSNAAPPLPWPGRPRYFTQACQGCRHYHGCYYGHDRSRTFLVCAMHPYGWPAIRCPDRQGL